MTGSLVNLHFPQKFHDHLQTKFHVKNDVYRGYAVGVGALTHHIMQYVMSFFVCFINEEKRKSALL